jgi:hypothetical protein
VKRISELGTALAVTNNSRNIPEDGILYSYRRENPKCHTSSTSWTLLRRRNVSPVRYELGIYIPEDGILHSHRCENLKSYKVHFKECHLLGYYAAWLL